MRIGPVTLGEFVKSAREDLGLKQDELVAKVCPGESRTLVALFEQGRRLPKKETLEKICRFLKIPPKIWEQFTKESARVRIIFEEALSELTGIEISGTAFEQTDLDAIEEVIKHMFEHPLTSDQGYHHLNRLLGAYRLPPMQRSFFDRFIGPDALKSSVSLMQHIVDYQRDVIRIFSTFSEAYERLNVVPNLEEVLRPLSPSPDKEFTDRDEWDPIQQIEEDQLEDLGYISAARIKAEEKERRVISKFLVDLAKDLRVKGKAALDDRSDTQKRRMDSLLRNLHSRIEHGFFSSLFIPDPDFLEKEATRLAPKGTKDLERIAQTQSIGKENLAKYLTSDFIDVYVATSMRTKPDFVSVNRFVASLFAHDDVRTLKLRYFNPTQSWVEDRVAKGLVEALMLKRSRITIYMAQKEDTFGKDSEASVALGQGKPVIVFVPKLFVPGKIDTEEMGKLQQTDLIQLLTSEGHMKEADIDEALDSQALFSRLLEGRLRNLDDDEILAAATTHWADFALEAEAVRITDQKERGLYHHWLTAVIEKPHAKTKPDPIVRRWIETILVSNAITFEKRAKTFREIHPLALQVILSSGMLNGIVVVRSVDSCAKLLHGLLLNSLSFDLHIDERNYRLIETITSSTIRVISRHRLLTNAFHSYFKPTG